MKSYRFLKFTTVWSVAAPMLIITCKAAPLLEIHELFCAHKAPSDLKAAPPVSTSGAAQEELPKPHIYYHVPGLVVTASGSVLAYAECRDSFGDWGNIHINMRRSTDGGKTWGPEYQIAHNGDPIRPWIPFLSPPKVKENDLEVGTPTAIVDRQTRAIHFLYQVEYGRCFYMHSEDDGVTFSKPTEITGVLERFRSRYPWRIVAMGPGHGIQLKNGRLICPVWISTSGSTGYEHHPSVTAVIYSDDHGRTWLPGDIVAKTTGGPDDPLGYTDPNESSSVQLADGDVLFNIRATSKAGKRLEAVSHDGATGWSAPHFVEDLPEPVCFGSIERLSETPASDRNRLLFSNPQGVRGGKRVRSDITVFLSYDEGETWPVRKVINPGEEPGPGYSDLAVLPDGTILCAFGKARCLSSKVYWGSIGLAHFNLEWLTDGKDSMARSAQLK